MVPYGDVTRLRRLAFPLAALALLLVAPLVAHPGPELAEAQSREFVRMACGLPAEYLERIWRGSRNDRGSDIVVVPKQPATFSLGFTHSGPWPFLQDVPILWYGPGHVRAGVYDRRVTVADIAPTIGSFVDYEFPAPDGRPMDEAIDQVEPPKLVVTLVLDGGGRVILDEWPDAWPFLRQLKRDGAWFENAEVGSTPSATAQVHGTIGTGAFPRTHALVGNRFRLGTTMSDPWSRGPDKLMRPTIADLYDLSTGNRAKIGGFMSVRWHMGMLGHGAFWGGGDRDIAFFHGVRGDGSGGVRWTLAPHYRAFYKFPAYVNRLPNYDADVRAVDQADGKLDGLWRSRSIERLRNGWDTPARLPAQTRAIEEVLKKERFGKDDVPDLVFINYKLIDHVGHLFSLNSREMMDTVVWQDREVRELVRFFDREVGRGEWVMVVTADHGHTPDPAVTGAFRISPAAVDGLIQSRFGQAGRVIIAGTPSDYYLNREVLEQGGHTVEDVARYLTTLTKGQTKAPGDALAPAEANERVFEAVLPKSVFRDLPCLPEAAEG